jgi:hypothetical protein
MLENLDKFCPNCDPVYVFKRPPSYYKEEVRVGVKLVTESSNYSGCGVDICSCLKCGKTFQVSYKIDEIIEVENESNS